MRVSLRVLARLDPAQSFPNQLVTRPIVVVADNFAGLCFASHAIWLNIYITWGYIWGYLWNLDVENLGGKGPVA